MKIRFRILIRKPASKVSRDERRHDSIIFLGIFFVWNGFYRYASASDNSCLVYVKFMKNSMIEKYFVCYVVLRCRMHSWLCHELCIQLIAILHRPEISCRWARHSFFAWSTHAIVKKWVLDSWSRSVLRCVGAHSAGFLAKMFCIIHLYINYSATVQFWF